VQYQLVLQLPVSSEEDFERMIVVEDELIEGLGGTAEVDGHDAGQGEVNIFVLTDQPLAVFERIRVLPRASALLSLLRIAYRPLDSDAYRILHPPSLTHFEVA